MSYSSIILEYMNTKIQYQYRDAGNYKWWDEIIVAGILFKDDLTPYMFDREFFIPSRIGLKDLQPRCQATGRIDWTDDDHLLHEIIQCTLTKEKPTASISADELLERFKRIGGDWF